MMDEQIKQLFDSVMITNNLIIQGQLEIRNLIKAHDQDVTSRLERLEEKLDGVILDADAEHWKRQYEALDQICKEQRATNARIIAHCNEKYKEPIVLK